MYRVYEHVGPLIIDKAISRHTMQNKAIKENIISNAGLGLHQFSIYYGTVYYTIKDKSTE